MALLASLHTVTDFFDAGEKAATQVRVVFNCSKDPLCLCVVKLCSELWLHVQ